MVKQKRFIVINREKDWKSGLLVDMSVEGDSLFMDGSEDFRRGVFYSASCDSGVEGFVWDRITVYGDAPKGTHTRLYVYTSDTKHFFDQQSDIDEYIKDKYIPKHMKASNLARLFNSPEPGFGDYLVNATGRYIWIKIEIISADELSVRIDCIRFEISGDHMVEYLPSIYRSEDKTGFTRRYLSIFNSMVLDLEDRIYNIHKSMDYENASGEMLKFLAGWVGVGERATTDEELRLSIKNAAWDYKYACTPQAIKRLIMRWTGHEPILVEHFHIKHNITMGKDRALYERLFGTSPYKFFVLLPEKAFSSRDEVSSLLEQLKEVIPAHVEPSLVLLKEGIYLDYHTYLGVNSVIGGYEQISVDKNVAIFYDTVVGESENLTNQEEITLL